MTKNGEALGYNNVVYRDTVGKYNMYGDFCHYNEYSGKGLATGKAWAEYFSDGNDTLYVHADTMKVFTYNMETDSIYRVVHGYFSCPCLPCGHTSCGRLACFLNQKQSIVSL